MVKRGSTKPEREEFSEAFTVMAAIEVLNEAKRFIEAKIEAARAPTVEPDEPEGFATKPFKGLNPDQLEAYAANRQRITDEKNRQAQERLAQGKALAGTLEPALSALDREIAVLEHKITPGNKQADIDRRRLITEFHKSYGPIDNKADFYREFTKSIEAEGKDVPSAKTVDRHLKDLGFQGVPGRRPKKES